MSTLFEGSRIPPPEGSESNLYFPLDEEGWIELRDSGLTPSRVSELVSSDASRIEFAAGARALGLVSERRSLKPQQLLVSDVLTAAKFLTGILEPRRSTKTSSILAVLMGRCFMRPDYRVGFTLATTGQKARERYRVDIVAPMERAFPDEDARPFRLYRGGGTERVEFGNGSVFSVVAPSGEAFRSSAYDAVLIDEGGEASPEMGEDMLPAILPTFDTVPDGQIIVAGTAAKYRKGNLLWDALNDDDAGALVYAAADTTTEEELAGWEPSEEHPEARVRELIELTHPGVASGLTTLDAIKRNFDKFKPDQFQREYLSLFGMTGSVGGLLNFEKWLAAGVDGDLPEPPERFTLAIAVHPNQTSAAVAAAWREDGKACIGLLAHKPGTKWLALEAVKFSRKYRTPIVHDSQGMVLVEVSTIRQNRPVPDLRAQVTRDITTAAGLLARELETGNIRHWNQEALTEAARVVVKRKIGQGNAWGLGRERDEDDIVPLEAAAMALRVYDEGRDRRPKRAVVAA